MIRRLPVSLLSCVGLLLCVAARGDEPARKPAAQAAEEFWFDRDRAGAAGVAELVGLRDPIACAAMRVEGKRSLVWGLEPEEDQVADRAPPLDPKLLALIPDKKAMPDLRGRPRDEWKPEEVAEYETYCQAVAQTWKTGPALFAKSAAENRGITWGHLFREPWKYRGKVIHVHGTLKRLRREDAPLCAQKEWVHNLYEGWVFTDTPGSNPVSVIITDLPPELKLGEDINYRVSFDGYFFKRYRYVSGKGPRDTLLFIAPTFKTAGVPPPPDVPEVTTFGNMPGGVVLVAGALLLATFAVILGLNIWFRRGDRKIHHRIDELRASMVAQAEDEERAQVTGVLPDLPPRDEHGLADEGEK